MKVATFSFERTRQVQRLHREDLGRHLDLHVALDLDLAGQPVPLARLAARDVAGLGGQHGAASVETFTTQTPQLPFPPQAEAMKMLVVGQSVPSKRARRTAP